MGALLNLAIAIAQENPPGTPRPGCSELCRPGMAGAPGLGAWGEVWLLKAGLVAKAFIYFFFSVAYGVRNREIWAVFYYSAYYTGQDRSN